MTGKTVHPTVGGVRSAHLVSPGGKVSRRVHICGSVGTVFRETTWGDDGGGQGALSLCRSRGASRADDGGFEQAERSAS